MKMKSLHNLWRRCSQALGQGSRYDGPLFCFDSQHCTLTRAKLDTYYAHLYRFTRDELRYISNPSDFNSPDYPRENFHVLTNNEIRWFGGYRTQRQALEA
jgi:hypothetical protein